MVSHVGLTRRGAFRASAVGAAIAAAAISGSSMAPAQPLRRMTYVLVPPAWHGGWCWKKVKQLLQARGHNVYTPTLTGLGERSHLARPEIGLDIHVQDIVNVLTYEDLSGVVLVGHSSSGVVITGVADRAPERLAHMVYLDAFVPEDGQSIWDMIRSRPAAGHGSLGKHGGKGLASPPFRVAAVGKVRARGLARDG